MVNYQLLGAIYPETAVRKWSPAEQLEHMYLYGIDSQFADTGIMSDAMALWDNAEQHALQPEAIAIPMGSKIALEWLRSRLLLVHVL